MAHRLNGWQRLWVVLVALWTIPFFLVGWAIWPVNVGPIVGEVREWNGETRQWDGAAWRLQSSGKLSPTKALAVPSMGLVEFPITMSNPEAYASARQVYEEGQTTLRSQRYVLATKLVGVWAASALFFYAVGWMGGWIRRGFRPDG